MVNITSYLKKVFCPNLFVGFGFQILDIQAYASGLKLESASILSQNPFLGMACRLSIFAGWCEVRYSAANERTK